MTSNGVKLLITTQAVDRTHSNLGFFHGWIEEFAQRCEEVHVVCLQKGEYQFPPNVHIYSLGKEDGTSRLVRLVRFYRYLWKLRNNYDAVFVHMNPEYVVLGGVPWKLLRKHIGLWYVHKSVTTYLRIAALFVDVIFTAAPESIRLHSKKIHIVGHGIDAASFSSFPLKHISATTPRIVVVGRITPIKHIETVVEALALLRDSGVDAHLDIIGAPIVGEDYVYEKKLRTVIDARSIDTYVTFRGAIANSAMPRELSHYDIAINASPTGGIDKVVLEAMASGIPTFVSNAGFTRYFGELSSTCMFPVGDAKELARRIKVFLESSDKENIQKTLRSIARNQADVSRLVPGIISALYGAGN